MKYKMIFLFSSSTVGSNPKTEGKDKSLLFNTSLPSPLIMNKLTIVVPFLFSFLFSLRYASKFSWVNSFLTKFSFS